MFRETLTLAALSLACSACVQARPIDDQAASPVNDIAQDPGETTRVKVRVWVPSRTVYVTKTRVFREARYSYDSRGRRVYFAPVTRLVRVPRHIPGYYRYEWRTQTVPTYSQHVYEQERPRRPRLYQLFAEASPPTTRSAEREAGRSARKTRKEARRAGRRIGKFFKRLAK